MKNIEKVYHYLFLIFCFIIPFEHLAKAVPNIILILLIALFPYRNLKIYIKFLGKEFVAILVFIFVIILNTLLFQRWEDFSVILRLFYIPLILVLSLPIKNINTCLKFFVLGSFSLLFLSSILIGIKVIGDYSFSLANGANVNDLLLGHRPYLGFMYLMATFFSFYLATKSKIRKLQFLYSALGICFVSFLFLIAARLSVISVLISLFLALFYFVKKIKKQRKWLLIIPIILLVLFGCFSNNLAKRFYIKDKNISFILAEPRYYIWDCVYSIMPNNTQDIIFGKGYKQIENELISCYQQKDDFLDAEHKQWFIESKFNTHNQFLGLFLSQGIIVLGLSLGFFIYLIMITRNNFFSFSLVIAFLLFFMVENVLVRQFGCLLLSFLLCFVFRHKRSITIKKDTEIKNSTI